MRFNKLNSNVIYLSPEQISERVLGYRRKGASVFASSSFQTHSIPLLHILSQTDSAIPIAFLNTGFLFPETLSFRDQIVSQLNLNLIELKSTVPKIQQLDVNHNFFFTSDTDRCCYINKVEPLEQILRNYNVWISGVRADQSTVRNDFRIEQPAANGCLRFHPMLGWNAKQIYEYRMLHELPEHPLEKQGYLSVGCEPCTRRINAEDGRAGRWVGQNKTECGLHTDLSESELQ